MQKLLLLSAALLCLYTAHSQQLPYCPYATFNNDVAAYLEYNFDTRGKTLYQGKTFDDLMKDMGIVPIGFMPTYTTSISDNYTRNTWIDLYFKHVNSDGRYDPLRDTFITIYWETPFISNALVDLIKQYPYSTWVSQHYDFFKDKVIESIEFNAYVKDSRNALK
jgi:hypothetical protein